VAEGDEEPLIEIIEDRIPRIGVGVVLLNDKRQILLGKRLKKLGYGFWSFPGGHLEFYESVIDCARREVKEETNLDVGFLIKGPYTEDFIEEEKHYFTMYVMGFDLKTSELQNMEPDKTEDWNWFDLNKLPDPVWRPVETLLTNVNLGVDFHLHDLRSVI
jgi:8-oxo-dGTP diphosphatase